MKVRLRVGSVGALTLFLAVGCAAAQDRPAARDPEPIVGKPCEGCEAVFEGRPDRLSSRSRIAPVDERGEPMRIEGTVYGTDGRPVPGVIVYAYHTDAEGIYPKDDRLRGQSSFHHGRLRGWARTDERGRYGFDTIRPASYPRTGVPAHVHMHVIEPGRCTYYIDPIHFSDDPLLTREEREGMAAGRGGSGLIEPRRTADGTWIVTRDITLGEAVPGYSRCS